MLKRIMRRSSEVILSELHHFLGAVPEGQEILAKMVGIQLRDYTGVALSLANSDEPSLSEIVPLLPRTVNKTQAMQLSQNCRKLISTYDTATQLPEALSFRFLAGYFQAVSLAKHIGAPSQSIVTQGKNSKILHDYEVALLRLFDKFPNSLIKANEEVERLRKLKNAH